MCYHQAAPPALYLTFWITNRVFAPGPRSSLHQCLLFSSLFIIAILMGCGCEAVFGGGFGLVLIIDGAGRLASAGWCFSLWLWEKSTEGPSIPHGRRWNLELRHTHSQVSLSSLFYYLSCVLGCVHMLTCHSMCVGRGHLAGVRSFLHCVGPGHQTEVAKLGSKHFYPPSHPVCPFLCLFKIGLFLFIVSFRAAVCVLATLPLSDTWFASVVLCFVFLFPWVNCMFLISPTGA